MLVLKRKINESIMIGDGIEVKILSLDKDGVRIGIEAPKEMPVYRKEIYLAIQEENREAVMLKTEAMKGLQDLFTQNMEED
ncbi:carbon storage regulator [[Clostridium] ultunense Esp]|uniref:carbon storage regulator CsrA n=1 Tax=Thermicanus aegyptius TaxID=94009 RepID=UPI0002B6F045|nr:carbon storage regulator CsrA [Thermicanus aegyptius]CCQ96425.1 carbon storage regulator [[Clostridium] ultunense Esp]